MMEIRLTKPFIEREEGVTHLWIRPKPCYRATIASLRLSIELPKGVHRLPNLTAHPEKEDAIVVDVSSDTWDVVIELYTETLVSFSVGTIQLTGSYLDAYGQNYRFTHSITLAFADEEETEEFVVDEEAVARLKQLPASPYLQQTEEYPMEMRPVIHLVSMQTSSLEKKYRIDGGRVGR